jgi:hypothetical protein
MTLDEQLKAMNDRMNEIQRLRVKRDMIRGTINQLSGDYDPVNNPDTMMNPLSFLNIALTYEQITTLSVIIIEQLATELAVVEAELATTLA